jgi:hypothetical protein
VDKSGINQQQVLLQKRKVQQQKQQRQPHHSKSALLILQREFNQFMGLHTIQQKIVLTAAQKEWERRPAQPARARTSYGFF